MNNFLTGDISKVGQNSKIFESSAAKKLNLLQGYEGIWIEARRNNFFYIMNKLISIGFACTFATITLFFKKTTIEYQAQMDKNDPNDQSAFHIRLIYWFMFIYYSLQAMDEMIELFSVINQLEKGALGLFFELNYLIGVFNAGHCFYFAMYFDVKEYDITRSADKLVQEQKQLEFQRMENFVHF